MIERWDQRRASLFDDRARELLAIIDEAVVGDDLRPISRVASNSSAARSAGITIVQAAADVSRRDRVACA